MSDTSKIALIIGVDSYYCKGIDRKPSLAQLPSFKKDALDICNLLSGKGYKVFRDGPLIGSLLDNKYGFVTIQESMQDFFDGALIGQTLLFYFSGHGIPRRDDLSGLSALLYLSYLKIVHLDFDKRYRLPSCTTPSFLKAYLPCGTMEG